MNPSRLTKTLIKEEDYLGMEESFEAATYRCTIVKLEEGVGGDEFRQISRTDV